jgi:predicted SAM-dependent methyltransferase
VVLRVGRVRGLRRELYNLRLEVFLLVRHLYGLVRARKLANEQPLKLNLGSFDDLREGWVNVDPLLTWSSALSIDLREPLPFPDASVELAHAEHFLEHISEEDAQRLVHECYRVLRPGGQLSITVPDAEPLLRAYAAEDRDFFERYATTVPPGYALPTPLGQINYVFRGAGTHLYAYDEETLRLLFEAAGFDDVHRRDFDPELDLEVRREGTLRLMGTKPATDAT